MKIRNLDRGSALADTAVVARGPIARGRGLMGRRGWSGSDGLVLRSCNSIHTFFMRMPIDVVYLSAADVVLRADPAVRPWRVGPIVWRAKHVLELPVGSIERTGTTPGDRITIDAGAT